LGLDRSLDFDLQQLAVPAFPLSFFGLVMSLFVLSACEPQSVESTPSESTPVASPSTNNVETKPSKDPSSLPVYSNEALRALGLQLTAVSDTQTLLCSANNPHCMCTQALSCTGAECPNFAHNISVFRKALSQPQGDRTVDCVRAEIGQCGSFKYFHFIGDIHRNEVRWFDANGQLIGQQNSTDYSAYCQNRALKVFYGQIPICENPTRVELICGDAEGSTKAPLAEFLRAR
jgi:hypothetical protein